jgi:hypothetical protein
MRLEVYNDNHVSTLVGIKGGCMENIRERDLVELIILIDLRSKFNRKEVRRILKRCKCQELIGA